MARKPQSKPALTEAERHARFLEAAREADASDDSLEFDRAFQQVAGPSKRAARKTPTQSND